MSVHFLNSISLIVVLCLMFNECNGQDAVYHSYNSYRRRNRNFNDDDIKKLVREEAERIEETAHNLELHALSFSNYPRFMNAQRIKRNVNRSANNSDDFIKILNEIKAIEMKENNLKQLWNGTSVYKTRRQEGMFLNTTAEKIYAANKARNTIYRAINYPRGNTTKGSHRLRFKRLVNQLNNDLNTVSEKQFDDNEVSSLRTEELKHVTSNYYSVENNKTIVQDNKNKTNLLGSLTHVEEVTSKESLPSSLETTVNFEHTKDVNKQIEITTKATNNFEHSSKQTEELINVTSNEFHQNLLNNTLIEVNKNRTILLKHVEEKTSKETLSSIPNITTNIFENKNTEITTQATKNFEVSSTQTEQLNKVTLNEFHQNSLNNNTTEVNKNKTTLLKHVEEITSRESSTSTNIFENKNIEITTQATKNFEVSSKQTERLNKVTSNELHKNQLNNSKYKTNLPGTVSKPLLSSVSKITTTTKLEKRQDDETSTQLTTTKQTLGSRILIHRVLQRNEVEIRPIMQMMTTLSLDEPHQDPVLIQVPPRRIICPPHQRLARGRCRTRW